jgi:hypothetical protein
MGTYVYFTAKEGCEDQINAAYRALTGDADEFIVYSTEVISKEIAVIHSPEGESQAHLRASLKTPADWNRLFPAWRSGTGQIKISSFETDERSALQRDVAFLLEHRMLLAEVTGLDDARKAGLTDFEHDALLNGVSAKRSEPQSVSFADLPKSDSAFYRRCVAHDRPDLWHAYLAFSKANGDSAWSAWVDLRCKTLPWAPKGTMGLWIQVEALATAQDGKVYGLTGRFSNGDVPPITLVRRALEETA